MDNDSRSCPPPLDTPLPTPPPFRFPNFTPPNTPGNEIFAFDEPSSVLASRIMRAQDNPSPPPVSPSNQMTFTNDTKLVDVSEPTTPCYLNAPLPGHVVPLLTTPNSPSLLCGLPSHQSPAQPHGDLITFDVEDESTATSVLTPSHCLSLPLPSDSRNTGDASEAVKEDSCKETESPFILHSNTKEAETPQSGDPSTLVRRSGRTRRSTTPHRTFPSITSEESHVQVNSPIETVPQASDARTRIKRKSVKTADVVEPEGHQSADKQHSAISGLEQNNDASNAGHYSHHRLSSLSPTSSHVLNQLVTTSRDETPHFSKPSISTEFTLTTAMQAMDFPRTPSKEPIYTHSPQRLQLDQFPSQTTQVRTPARRILVGEAPPSRNKPFNTSSTSSSHALNFCPPRTPISRIPSSDSPARHGTNATNNSEDTLPDKTFSAELLRIGTPRRQLLDRSPSKNLPPAQFRTPARRIMVEEAQASGSKRSNMFPQMATSRNVLNLRNPMFRINSNDSPARRGIINDTVTADPNHTKHDNTLLHSPIRGTAVRSHSEEPSTTKAVVKSRSNSVEPRPQLERLAFSKSTDLRAPPSKLPFPLIPEAIPEEPVNETRPGAPSALVSVLKQRTSKIPRIGTKPYARPTRSASNKLLDPVRRVGPPNQTLLLPSSSQSARKIHPQDERSTQETVSAHPTTNSFTAGSKRKRTPDDTLIASKVSTTLPSTMPDSITQQATRIIDTTPQLSNTPTAHDKSDSSQPPVMVVGDTPRQLSLNALTEEKRHLHLGDRTPVPGSSKTLVPDSQPAETMESNSAKARRTARSRTRTTPATTMTASRSSQSRRRVNNSTTSDVFNSMSAVALKALTNSNTVRNQQYIAAKIETEVIRKPGLRPTSPTVKVQTVLQRTQDEKSRERRERAQRRAQRDEEMLQNGPAGTQQQPESPTLVALHLNIDHDTGDLGRCDGHRRGAGDEEDYQPHDPQSKKRKVTNGLEHIEARNGRRVKWDKGLYTEVQLDEIQLGARLLHKHQATLKGCLAPTSKKAAQLDTMGNLPTASLPVQDLVEECIVVKKFVYDDDEEPPPPIALGTRSKVKKKSKP